MWKHTRLEVGGGESGERKKDENEEPMPGNEWKTKAHIKAVNFDVSYSNHI